MDCQFMYVRSHSYLSLESFGESLAHTCCTVWAGVDLKDYPLLEKWLYRCLEVPGFEAGRHVPTPHKALEQSKKSQEELDKEAAASRGWIQSGMKQDAQK